MFLASPWMAHRQHHAPNLNVLVVPPPQSRYLSQSYQISFDHPKREYSNAQIFTRLSHPPVAIFLTLPGKWDCVETRLPGITLGAQVTALIPIP